ncbi:MAG: LCP family protein [Culicoidibacterales bacterium]
MLKKVFIGIMIVLVALTITVGAIIGGLMWHAQSEMTFTEIDPTTVGVKADHALTNEGIISIALFGVDARTPDEPGRSDSMMIATFNPKTQKVYLTSLMRDLLVPIDGHGNDKLNHAYAYGGAAEAIKVLNNTLDLNIQHYASVDFTSLQKVIDTLGGVAVDIDDEELPHLQTVGVTTTGVQQLTGEQALAYSRIRYATGGDYKRTERQQEILVSLAQSVQAQGLQGALAMANEVLPYVETNIDLGMMAKFGAQAMQIGFGNLTQQRFPQDGTFTTGIDPSSGLWVINADLNQVKEELHASFLQE